MSSQTLSPGWNISPQGLELISENNTITDKNILLKNALNSDLREIGLPVLPKELNKSQITQLVLQIQKIRNVSAPKANEDSQAAPRMLKLTLTDGENYVQAIENSTISSISRDKTPPGSKLLLTNVKILNGFLILNLDNTKLLGGIVPHLFEKWELAKSVQYCSRPTVSSDGPPAWVNFGAKILTSGDEFKSDNKVKEQPKENSEFEALRQGAIAVASTGAVKKVFGGGVKQPVQNNNYNKGKPDGNRGNNRVKKEVKNGKDKEIEERPQKPSDKVSLFDFLEDKLNITDNVTGAKNKTDEIPQNYASKPVFEDKRNYYNNDKNYSNQRNNYPRKDFNNFNDRKYNQKEQVKRESNRYYEHNKFEIQNEVVAHKTETNRTQEQYNTKYNNTKPFQYNKEENAYKKDTNRNQDHFNSTKRYGKNETNQTNQSKDPNKFIRNERERMKDNWHYRAPDKSETTHNFNSNVDNLTENMGKMSVNSEFASRSLRQHLNLDGKKQPVQTSNESSDPKKFNIGDNCLVKYWEDGKFYPARITAFTDTTYVVQFKGYGNIEEVLKTDCAPFRPQDRTDEKRHYKGSLEFRRNPRKFTSS